jgi:CRP-like cAMP-binding protein
MTMTTPQKLDVLARSPLFEQLSQPELQMLAELSRPRRFTAGEVVFHEGDLGDALFVITSGEVDVVRDGEGGKEHVLATLRAPMFFGEMSLIDKEYRSATVRARAEAELLQLTADNLNSFRRNYRDGFLFLVVNIARVLSSRLRDANAKLAGR